MTDDELEFSILEKYVVRHQEIETTQPLSADKCARELDMREVIHGLTGEEGANLDYIANLWINRLAPQSSGVSKGLLRPCSNGSLNTSTHKYHVRAFTDPINNAPAPAWDRIRELREKISNSNRENFNNLLSRKGSIIDQFNLARKLDDDQLQIAASVGNQQAKEELERRRHERLLAVRKSSVDQEAITTNEVVYVDLTRINELRSISSSPFDLNKLIRLCEELNTCYGHECYFAVAMLMRAILDHVPPIFGLSTFGQIANNYKGTRSFKMSMKNLDSSLRNIADAHLHNQIRPKEVLPNKTQVNFSQALDVLLEEVVRCLK